MAQWIRNEKRLALYIRDHFRCAYCDADLSTADAAEITLDHLVPRSQGGGNEGVNLVTSCRSCNCSRQDKPLARFADAETRRQIRRQVRRALNLNLARQLLAAPAMPEEP